MAKWFGKVGYGHSVEVSNGRWEDEIVERSYYGDVIKNNRRIVVSTEINADVTTNNQIEIVADPYALDHFFAIRYVEWAGTLWVVSSVDERRPRLILSLGVRYNGPKPAEPDAGFTPVSETEATEPTGSDVGW
jgi:hypothetical protein